MSINSYIGLPFIYSEAGILVFKLILTGLLCTFNQFSIQMFISYRAEHYNKHFVNTENDPQAPKIFIQFLVLCRLQNKCDDTFF